MAEILGTISGLALTLFTVCSLGGVGLSMTVKQIVEPLKNVRLLVLMLLGNFLLIPLLGVVINVVLPLSVPGKTAIILMACVAGAPFIPLLVQLAKGHMPLAAASMVLLTIVSIFYAPFVVPLLLPEADIRIAELAQAMLISMLVPLIVGLIIKARHPDAAARFQPTVQRTSMVAALVLLLAILPLTLPDIIASIGAWIIPATILLALGAIVIGYLVGHGQGTEQKKSTAFSAGQRNLAAALIMASTISGEAVAMTLVASGVLSAVNVIVAMEWGKRSKDPAEAEEPEAEAAAVEAA